MGDNKILPTQAADGNDDVKVEQEGLKMEDKSIQIVKPIARKQAYDPDVDAWNQQLATFELIHSPSV